ncbi:MAG: hypothetical protein SVX43_05260 [Cyanobacteriota bacterium]|nr:hypothetical protein [Cyanobacteriota bacterium]
MKASKSLPIAYCLSCRAFEQMDLTIRAVIVPRFLSGSDVENLWKRNNKFPRRALFSKIIEQNPRKLATSEAIVLQIGFPQAIERSVEKGSN